MNGRYLRARLLDCVMFGMRAAQRVAPRAHAGGRIWPRFGVDGGCVALTIDDGPHPQWTPRMLDLLAEHGVRATFFLIGGNVARHPGLARRIAGAGHCIGNHSMSHPQPFAALSNVELCDELDRAQMVIEDAVGFSPKVFRSPGGGWSPQIMRAVNERGMAIVDWTVNPSDWKQPGAARIGRSLSRAGSGHVMLCHDGGGDRSQTVAALTTTLPLLQARGLRFVGLDGESDG